MENRKRPGLTTAIFIGLALGAAAGILLHYAVPEGDIRDKLLIDGLFYLIGNGFLRLMQMLVVPLVFCSLVCGSMSMGDTKKLGKIGIKTLGFYLATTALAITAAILTAHVINPGAGLDLSSLETARVEIGEKEGLADTLLAIIPVNPVRALADGDMLSIILFALIVGIILAGGILFRDIDGIIYGMIVNYLFAVVVDKIMYGINAGKMAMIVTERGKEICEIIDNCCQRGTTILKGQGGYQGDTKQVVMCACSNKEMYLVQRAVKNADPAAFIIVLESNEVHGEGFHMIQIGEHDRTHKVKK